SSKDYNFYFLITTLSSFAADYAARGKVGGKNLNLFILRQLPVLPPESFEDRARWLPSQTVGDWVYSRISELYFTSRSTEIAEVFGRGTEPFTWNLNRRTFLRAELDGAFFHLYGLTRDEVEFVMESFLGLKTEEEKVHREYRTKRLIL